MCTTCDSYICGPAHNNGSGPLSKKAKHSLLMYFVWFPQESEIILLHRIKWFLQWTACVFTVQNKFSNKIQVKFHIKGLNRQWSTQLCTWNMKDAVTSHLLFVFEVNIGEVGFRDSHCVTYDDTLPLCKVVYCHSHTCFFFINHAKCAAEYTTIYKYLHLQCLRLSQ